MATWTLTHFLNTCLTPDSVFCTLRIFMFCKLENANLFAGCIQEYFNFAANLEDIPYNQVPVLAFKRKTDRPGLGQGRQVKVLNLSTKFKGTISQKETKRQPQSSR